MPKEKELHRKLIELNHQPLEHYIRMIYITDAKEKNPEGALKLVQEALAKYPSDKDLLREEARLYLDTGKGKEAIAKLENAANAVNRSEDQVELLCDYRQPAGEKQECRRCRSCL